MEILFLAKKVITFFVEPLGLILTIAFIGLYFLYKSHYKKAKFFLSLSALILLFLSYPPIANHLIKQLESKYSQYNHSHKNIEYIHVLGSDHHNNPDWPLSSQMGNASLKRTLEGINIFKQIGKDSPTLIFTGYAGPGNTTSNADMNAKIARIANIKDSNMLINGKPKDTQEEANFTHSIIGNKPFVLVTSATHMPRAMMLFKNMGMNPVAAPTDFKGKNESLLSAPRIVSFEKSQIAIHEFLGSAWANLIK